MTPIIEYRSNDRICIDFNGDKLYTFNPLLHLLFKRYFYYSMVYYINIEITTIFTVRINSRISCFRISVYHLLFKNYG